MIAFLLHKLPARTALAAGINHGGLFPHDAGKAGRIVSKAGGIADEKALRVFQKGLESIRIFAAVRPGENAAVGYRRAADVLSDVLDGRAMLVAPDGRELITLNGTGTAVWEALGEIHEPDAIAARLHAERPDVALAVLESDVRAFLNELENESLVVHE